MAAPFIFSFSHSFPRITNSVASFFEIIFQLVSFFFFLSDDFFQLGIFIFQTVHNVQLPPDEPFGKRLFYIIATMDGKIEIIKRSLHISFVEGFSRIVILLVGLALLQGIVDDVVVVVLTRKLFDFISYEDFIVTDGFLKADSFQTGASGKCYVCLSACKYASCEVNLYLFESEALTFVNGDGPRQSEWILGISADFLFFYLFSVSLK